MWCTDKMDKWLAVKESVMMELKRGRNPRMGQTAGQESLSLSQVQWKPESPTWGDNNNWFVLRKQVELMIFGLACPY